MRRTAGEGRSTIYDIATATRSSPSTVSLVLNGTWARYRINPGTAERILESARQLGYHVNLKARGLRLSRSGLAGMILPHYRNRFFAELAEAFEAEARRRALCPIVVSTQRDAATESKVAATLLAQQVEFLFIAGVRNPDPLNRACARAETPCVNIDLPGEGAPSVVTDNRAGARWLTDVLVRKVTARHAHPQHFAYLGGFAGEHATDERAEGFRAALRGAGVAGERIVRCGYTPTAARQAIADLHGEAGALPRGLFINSITAFEGFVDFAATLPERELAAVAIGCFDWDPFAARLPFDVVMLRQDVRSIMARAFAALSPEQQAERPFVAVPAVLVEAGSTAKA